MIDEDIRILKRWVEGRLRNLENDPSKSKGHESEHASRAAKKSAYCEILEFLNVALPTRRHPVSCQWQHPRIKSNDPLEAMMAHALDASGIHYLVDGEDPRTKGLDFWLPEYNCFIEVKSGHTPRILEQMSRDFNVIAVQGLKSVGFICDMISNFKKAGT